MKNYYAILGVDKDATLDEIKKAYRELVRRYHPDMGESSDVEKFLEVQEAFEVLRDEERRAAYNRKIESLRHRSPHFEGHLGRVLRDFEFLLNQIKSFEEGSWFSSGEGRSPEYFVEENLTVEILLTPEEARSGGNITLDVPVMMECPYCDGSGVTFPFRCFNCGGTGVFQTHKAISIKLPQISKPRSQYRIDLGQFGIRGQLNVIFKVSYY